jgi:hypothetical protein
MPRDIEKRTVSSATPHLDSDRLAVQELVPLLALGDDQVLVRSAFIQSTFPKTKSPPMTMLGLSLANNKKLSAHPQSDLVPMMLPEMLIASEGAVGGMCCFAQRQ